MTAHLLTTAQARLFRFQLPKHLSEAETLQAIRWQLRSRVADSANGYFSVLRSNMGAEVLYWSDRTQQTPIHFPAQALRPLPNTLIISAADQAMVLPSGEVLFCALADNEPLPSEMVLALARDASISRIHGIGLSESTQASWTQATHKNIQAIAAPPLSDQVFQGRYALADDVHIKPQTKLWGLNFFCVASAIALLASLVLWWQTGQALNRQEQELSTALKAKGMNDWAQAQIHHPELNPKKASTIVPPLLQSLGELKLASNVKNINYEAGLVNMQLLEMNPAFLANLEKTLQAKGVQVRCVLQAKEVKCQLSK